VSKKAPRNARVWKEKIGCKLPKSYEEFPFVPQ